MKQMKLALLLSALVAMAVVPESRASLINFSTDSTSVSVGGGSVDLGPSSFSANIPLNSVTPTVVNLSPVTWTEGSKNGTGSASQSLTISSTSPNLMPTSKTLSENLAVTSLFGSVHLLAVSAAPLVYSWIVGAVDYQLTVIPLGAFLTGSGMTPLTADVFFTSTSAVPEPTTVIAGAFLLLPFGASTVRLLRKSRTA